MDKTLSKLDQILAKDNLVNDPRKQFVYGLAKNRNRTLFDRLDDFLIDHSRVPLKEKAYFFHLLAVMIDAGIPVMTAMEILSKKADNVRLARILYTISYDLKQGTQLSKAMAKYPDVFGEMELGVVKSGEAAGNLDKMLFKLSAELDKSNELQIKLVTASIYPIAVLVVLVLASTGMMTFVIPQLVTLLKEGGLQEDNFPPMTKLLILISNFTLNYWWLLIAGALIAYFAFNFWVSTEDGKFRWHYLVLRMPVLGELLRKVYVLRFVSTLGILLESGLPVIKALEIVATSMTNQLYQLKAFEVIHKVKDGAKISEALMDSSFLFSETVISMLNIGEKTAQISRISAKISEHYDREIDHSIKRLTSLFEPIMIVTVGITVALLALAILTPIFQLTQLVQT